MKLALIGRMAGVLALTMGLAACVDMTEEINIESETTAKATMTMTMAADVYSMLKSRRHRQHQAGRQILRQGWREADREFRWQRHLRRLSEGTFADLKFDEGDSKPTFTVVSPGVVRASFPTKDMAGSLAQGQRAIRRPPR